METPIVGSIIIVIVILWCLRLLEPNTRAKQSSDNELSGDENVVYVKNDDDLRRILGRPLSPSDRSLIRRFDEMNAKEMRQYAGEHITAD